MSNKRRVKKTIKHTHSYGEGADKLLSTLKEFGQKWEAKQKELIEKHNELAAQVSATEQLTRQVAQFAAGEFGKMQARLNVWFQSVDGALHHHDVNDLAAAEILKEVFGQLTQIDTYFRKANISPEMSDADVEVIKKEAIEWFESVMRSAFSKASEQVNREREEAAAARKAEEEKLAAEKQKAAEDKSEAERMESELRDADMQDRGLAAMPGGGTEQENLGVPSDVRIFGMT